MIEQVVEKSMLGDVSVSQEIKDGHFNVVNTIHKALLAIGA